MTHEKQRKQQHPKAELDTLDPHPADVAEKRTDDLLRSLLATPPEPFTPKAKPKKQAKK